MRLLPTAGGQVHVASPSWRIPFGVRGRVPAFVSGLGAERPRRGLVYPRRQSGVMPPHSKVLRHADAAGEQVGHEAGFQQGQLSPGLQFKAATRIQRRNSLNYSGLLISVGLDDKQCLQLADIEMLLSKTALNPQNLVATK